MNTFLKLVAKSLLVPFEGEQMIDLSKIIIIFPNKRAYLFLNKYLMELCDEIGRASCRERVFVHV